MTVMPVQHSNQLGYQANWEGHHHFLFYPQLTYTIISYIYSQFVSPSTGSLHIRK